MILERQIPARRDFFSRHGLHEAEIQLLMEYEWARTAEDVLFRRTRPGIPVREQEIEAPERRMAQHCHPQDRLPVFGRNRRIEFNPGAIAKGSLKVTKTGLAVLALLASSTAHAQPADPVAGEEAFVADCVQCHASAARIVRKIGGSTAEEKSSWLDAFLEDHHVSDIDKKADLIAYLAGL